MFPNEVSSLAADEPQFEFPPLEPPAPPPQANGRGRFLPLLLVTALIGGGAGSALTLALTNDGSARIVERVATSDGTSSQSLTGVAAVAKKVIPSIVRIDVTETGAFGRRGQGTGSGVIFTADGYILTNQHVVDGASTISVTLSTGEKLTGRVVGTAAPVDDIAVVKVDKTGLPAATLGSTANVNVGDGAVAIGSPFGLQGTVTSGVISALHRNIDLGGETLTDAIQTDAPINPGNSGGALADANGSVIGINTAILGSSGGNVGVGFAIPIEIARRDAEQIISSGKVSRPFMGITGESIPNDGGALIQQVSAGGPAAKAGLRAGDIVTAIDSVKVTSMTGLIAALNRHQPGDTVTVSYTRDGGDRTAKLTLGSRSS